MFMETIPRYNFILRFFSSTINLLINLLFLLYVARELSDIEFGKFNYLITLGSLLIYFLTSGFSETFVYYYSKNKNKQEKILKIFLLLYFLLY